MIRARFRTSLILALALLSPAVVLAHGLEMFVGSSAPSSGALKLGYTFSDEIPLPLLISVGGTSLYSDIFPGYEWIQADQPADGLYALKVGTRLTMQIVAIDSGASVKLGSAVLNAAGQSAFIAATTSVPGDHFHPQWQLTLPNGVVGDYSLSFKVTTTTAPYTESPVYTLTFTNSAPTPTSTLTPTRTLTPTTTPTPSASETPTPTVTLPASTATIAASTATTTTTATPSASPTPTATDSPVPTATVTTDDLLPGKRLLLVTKVGVPAKSGLRVRARASSITLGSGNGSADDPTAVGATIRVGSLAAGFDDTYDLPAAYWTVLGKPGQNQGYKYKDKALAAGPIESVVIRNGRVLALIGKGAALGHTLFVDPAPVDVTISIGNHRYCLLFGGERKWSAAARFKAVGAAPPPACAS